MKISIKSPSGIHFAVFDDADSAIAGMGWRVDLIGRKPYLKKSDGAKSILAHRVVMGCERGDGQIVDHINGNALDNRRCNLRIVSCKENAWNRAATARSGYFGVQMIRPGVFTGRVRHNGGYHYCGSHATAEDAAIAVNAKLLELRGSFARLNVIPESEALCSK